MAAENHEWTISDIGSANGPSGSDHHRPGGQIDFTPTWGRETWDEAGNYSQDAKGARQDVPYQFDFHKNIPFSGEPGRVDVPDPDLPGGIPAPYCGEAGDPIDFGAVAPDTDRGVTYDLEGVNAPAASGTGVLFRGGGPLD